MGTGWIIGKEGTLSKTGKSCYAPAWSFQHTQKWNRDIKTGIWESVLLTAELGFTSCRVDRGWIHPKPCTYQTVSWTRSCSSCPCLPDSSGTLSRFANVNVLFCNKNQGVQRRSVYFLNCLRYRTGQKARCYVTLTYTLPSDAFCICSFPLWPGHWGSQSIFWSLGHIGKGNSSGGVMVNDMFEV